VGQAAADALARLTPVQIKFSRGTVQEVACNRRVPLPDGTIGVRYGRNVPAELRAYPEGLIDPEALCAWLVDERGELIGSIVNYACHATSYNQYSEICWDYPGFAAEEVERELGGTCLILQGCAGNMSPGKYTVGEPLEDSKRMGRYVADAVIAGYPTAEMLKDSSLLFANEYVTTGLRVLRSKDELERMLQAEIEKYKELHDAGPGLYNSTNIMSLTERILILNRFPELKMPSEVAVVKLGELLLVFLPGEMFIQSTLALKAKFPQAKLMVMAYTDVSLEYVPNEGAFSERGGYETCEEWCFSVPGNAEALEEKAVHILQQYM
jgi:neutral ceramidase